MYYPMESCLAPFFEHLAGVAHEGLSCANFQAINNAAFIDDRVPTSSGHGTAIPECLSSRSSAAALGAWV